MRNPGRWRTINLVSLAIGALVAIVAFAMPATMAGDSTRTTLFILGATAIVFGGGAAAFRHLEARSERSLSRGRDVVARWHVNAETWQGFVELERELRGQPRALPNEFTALERVPVGGVDVIAGRSAISIDGSIHRLDSVVGIRRVDPMAGDAWPACIEFQLHYDGGGYGDSGASTSDTRTVLRFPVAPGAEREAASLLAHFDGSQPRKPDVFHGRGDGSDPEDLNTCWTCGYATHQLLSHCPACGSGMQTRRWARRLGCVVSLCGLFVAGVMGVVLAQLAPMLLHPGLVQGTSRFSGSPLMAMGLLALLGLPFVFGVTALAYGFWQMWTGRRSRKVVAVMLGLCAVLLAMAVELPMLGR